MRRSPRSVHPSTTSTISGDDTTVAGPDDPWRARRLAWTELLKRAWRIDTRECQQCGGRMGLVAVILDAEVAAKIIRHLGVGTRAPPTARRVTPDPWDVDAALVD